MVGSRTVGLGVRGWGHFKPSQQLLPGPNQTVIPSNKSAPRLVPVGRQFPWTYTRLKPQALREDRILQEIHASGGDIRRICDLFGVTVQTALRYADTLREPPAPIATATGVAGRN